MAKAFCVLQHWAQLPVKQLRNENKNIHNIPVKGDKQVLYTTPPTRELPRSGEVTREREATLTSKNSCQIAITPQMGKYARCAYSENTVK